MARDREIEILSAFRQMIGSLSKIITVAVMLSGVASLRDQAPSLHVGYRSYKAS